MSTMEDYKNRIEPTIWSHAEFLWNLGNAVIFDTNIRKRLQSVATLMKFRPDINAPESFKFELGKTYLSYEGKLVKVVEVQDAPSYEAFKGDDSVWRYNRPGDLGRTTGTDGAYPKNLIPIAVKEKEIQETQPAHFSSADHDIIEGKWSKRFKNPRFTKIKPNAANHTAGPVMVHAIDQTSALVSRTDIHQNQMFWIATEKLEPFRK